MNDFTKEELFNLWIMTCAWVGHNSHDEPSVKLQDKLKNMLDNYCEHDWAIDCHNCVIEQVMCNFCGLAINDQQPEELKVIE